MNSNQLLKGSIIRTIFVFVELVTLIVISIITFLNDGTSVWGYWGTVAAVFISFSPIFAYVIASTIFNVFNMKIVLGNRHTAESIKKYYELSRTYLAFGIVVGALYGFLLIPIFLLENIFLFNGYEKELKKIKNM